MCDLFVAFCIFGAVDLVLVGTTCVNLMKLLKKIEKGDVMLKAVLGYDRDCGCKTKVK